MRWLTWVLGIAVLGVVVVASLHVADADAFLRLAERARPWWLGAAVGLQSGTYVAQGWIWRMVGGAAGYPLSRAAALELAFAKLFADEVVPSAGLSSTLLIARALDQRSWPPGAGNASVLVNMASYHMAYVLALTVALAIAQRDNRTSALVTATAVLFLLFSLGVSLGILGWSGHRLRGTGGRMARFTVLRTLSGFMAGADGALVRNRRVLVAAVTLQSVIVVLDAATVWTLIGALGVAAPASGVFVGFMIASLFRTMGIVPGGLGTFEATSVLMLRKSGVDVAAALSATLLFRGLSFWLPMLPGYWCSRRVLAGARPAGGAPRQ